MILLNKILTKCTIFFLFIASIIFVPKYSMAYEVSSKEKYEILKFTSDISLALFECKKAFPEKGFSIETRNKYLNIVVQKIDNIEISKNLRLEYYQILDDVKTSSKNYIEFLILTPENCGGVFIDSFIAGATFEWSEMFKILTGKGTKKERDLKEKFGNSIDRLKQLNDYFNLNQSIKMLVDAKYKKDYNYIAKIAEFFYLGTNDCQKSVYIAYKLNEYAASKNNCSAILALAYMNMNGIIDDTNKIQVDLEKANMYLVQAKKLYTDDKYGDIALAYSYFMLKKNNKKEYIRYLNISADKGNENAKKELKSYEASRKNESEKYKHIDFNNIKRLAENGDSNAQNNLGLCLEEGLITKKDENMAFYWYQKSAEQGNSRGQNSLGYCYENGIGTTIDKEKSFYWYQKSAEQGNADALNNVGNFYLNGIVVNKDELKALYFYQQAAEKGNPIAQFNIGCMYFNGLGLQQDKEKACFWLKKSSEQGYNQAKEALSYCK